MSKIQYLYIHKTIYKTTDNLQTITYTHLKNVDTLEPIAYSRFIKIASSYDAIQYMK